MCGISGFSLNPNDKSVNNSRKLAGNLLLGIEHRGKDSTGASWYAPDGEQQVQKHAVTATAFVRNLSMWKKTTDAILHTRMWTQGSPDNNDNNHPIVTGPITGVHNGGLWNDNSIFTQLGADVDRIAEVDSEAAFAAIAYGVGRLGHSTKAKTLMDCLEAIQGTAALAWFDADDDKRTLHLARVCSSPLIIAQNQHGSFFFASTKDTIVKANDKLTNSKLVYVEEVKEGTYLAVREGRIVETTTFTPAERYGYQTSYHTTSSYSDSSVKSYKFDSAYSYSIGRQAAVKAEAASNDLDSKYFGISELVQYEAADLDVDYKARMESVDDYDYIHGRAASNALGANIYPSKWVTTELAGKLFHGQIMSIPNEFPGGKYTVRLMVTQPNQQVDVVFVQRTTAEMDWTNDYDAQTVQIETVWENDDIEEAEQLHNSLLETAEEDLFPAYY